MHDVSDHELLERYCRKREEAAFVELVRRHCGGVYAISLRQVGGDRQLAQDVVQVVFTALARKSATLLDRAALGGWLCRTAQFAARDVVRAERRRRAREEEAVAMNERFESDAQVDPARLRTLLDGALAGLSEEDRCAVWLRYYERKSFAQIGACLRVKENAARMRVERALEKMRGRLARRGIQSTAATLGVVLGEAAGAPAPASLVAVVAGKALAAAQATGALGSFVALMTSKILIGTIGVLAGGAVGFAVNYGMNRSLRAETLTLRQQVQASARVGEENEELRRAARESTAEVDTLLTAVDQARVPVVSAAAPAPMAASGDADGVTVVGHVKNSGLVHLGAMGTYRVGDAINFAGGMDPIADRRRIKVSRILSGGEVQVQVLDLSRLSQGSSAVTFTLQPGDIIYVPARTI